MRKHLAQFIPMLLLLGQPFAAMAACCDGVGTSDWDNPAEVLEYHACGCADACWVAEVKHRRSRRLKARLRCDCEKAYFSVGPGAIGGRSERVYANSCERFERSDKFVAINQALKQVLGRPARAKPAASAVAE